MLKLKELHISNIGRFTDTQIINFESIGNLVQVDGENKNTGGSSGSGKSTIFNSLDYLLGLNDLPTTVLQSRLTKDLMNVTGIYDWDNKVLEITRGKKGLKITVDGEQKDNGSKIAEEYLDIILGMPRTLFRKMMHKRQKEGGFFLDFTPKQTNDFLQDCLNLSEYKNKSTVVENKIKELESSKIQLSSKLESNRSSLKATQDAIFALGNLPIQEIDQNVILKLKNQYDISINTFKELEVKHKLELQELEKERPETVVLPYDRSNLDQYEQKKRSLESQLNSIVMAEKDRQSKVRVLISEKNSKLNTLNIRIRDGELSKKKAVEIASQIKKIRDSLCPTCNQTWVTEAAKTKETELLNELIGHKETISIASSSKEELDSLTIEIQYLNYQLAPIEDPNIGLINSNILEINTLIKQEKINIDQYNFSQNENNRKLTSAFISRQNTLTNKHSMEMNSIRGQADIDRRSLESAVQKMKSYDEAKSRYNNTLQKLKFNESSFDNEIKLNEEKLERLNDELEQAEELKKIIKSFTSCSFDNALEVISDTATKIIRNIPNMANATIQLEGIKETKEGKVKEEVNAVISMDGELGIPIKSLSGGERSSVDLAVDLAVIDFIESQTGKGCDIFILDEPFTGLDSTSIEHALKILQNSNINKKLIIVDHNEVVKQMVGDRIVVIRDGTNSTIVQ